MPKLSQTELWCLMWETKDRELYPLYFAQDYQTKEWRFWLGGTSVILAAYLNYQSAYAQLKKAQEDVEEKKIIVKKIFIHMEHNAYE